MSYAKQRVNQNAEKQQPTVVLLLYYRDDETRAPVAVLQYFRDKRMKQKHQKLYYCCGERISFPPACPCPLKNRYWRRSPVLEPDGVECWCWCSHERRLVEVVEEGVLQGALG